MEENKQEKAPDVAKRDAMIDKYIRRQAVIKSKFPQISEAPKSIQDEYFALSTLVDALKTSRRGVWGLSISSDGCQIDTFVEEKYERALARYSELNEKNREYITEEEEENFKFPEIDFETLEEEIQGMQTDNDFEAVYEKMRKLKAQVLPEETKAKLNRLTNDMYKIASRDNLNIQRGEKAETLATVNESKFAEIYGKAKGRIKQVFSKIKSFMQEKTQDKSNDSNDNQDLDTRD